MEQKIIALLIGVVLVFACFWLTFRIARWMLLTMGATPERATINAVSAGICNVLGPLLLGAPYITEYLVPKHGAWGMLGMFLVIIPSVMAIILTRGRIARKLIEQHSGSTKKDSEEAARDTERK